MKTTKTDITIPSSNSSVLTLKDFSLHETYFTKGEKKFELADVFQVEYTASKIRVNFFYLTDYIFKVYLSKKFDNFSHPSDLIVVDFTHHNDLNKDEQVMMETIHMLLNKATFERRALKFIKSISEYGYFSYPPNFKIYNNGDVYISDEKVLNLIEANENELVEYGTTFRGIRSKEENPYDFVVYKSRGYKFRLGPIDFYKSVKINVKYDKDCFDILMTRLFQTSKLL